MSMRIKFQKQLDPFCPTKYNAITKEKCSNPIKPTEKKVWKNKNSLSLKNVLRLMITYLRYIAVITLRKFHQKTTRLTDSH